MWKMGRRRVEEMGMRVQFSVWRLLVASMVCSIGEASSEFHVDTDSGRIVDSSGRERVFHGLNVVMKGSPWHPSIDSFDPQLSFADEDIANLKDWGLNVVRLAIMWPGVEPQRGHFNHTYITIMQAIVRKLHSAGIYTLLEFHQDLFSSRFALFSALFLCRVKLGAHGLCQFIANKQSIQSTQMLPFTRLVRRRARTSQEHNLSDS